MRRDHPALPDGEVQPAHRRVRGPIENRARFWVETLETVREAVGGRDARSPLACASTPSTTVRSGSEPPRRAPVHRARRPPGRLLGPAGRRLGGGRVGGRRRRRLAVRGRVLASRPHRRGPRATEKPVAAVGRFTNPDTMAEAIRSGVIDIIAAARPSIADPFLPQKIEEGRYDEIRECIGCNVCASRFPQVGADHLHPERDRWARSTGAAGTRSASSRPSNADRDVLVVGAGPAGMECAMVLGKRGMRRVHLVDDSARDRRLHAPDHAPTRISASGAGSSTTARSSSTSWRTSSSILTTRLSAEDVLDYGAEIVVIATGARWRNDGMNGPTQAPIPGAEAANVYTPEQVFGGAARSTASTWSSTTPTATSRPSRWPRCCMAAGKRVTVMTSVPEPRPVPLPHRRGLPDQPPAARRAGSRSIPEPRRPRDRRQSPQRRRTRSPGPGQWSADSVVLVTQREPCDRALSRAAAPTRQRFESEGIEAVYRIGDCVAPRLIADCVFDGHRLAREIDSRRSVGAAPVPARGRLAAQRAPRPRCGRRHRSSRTAMKIAVAVKQVGALDDAADLTPDAGRGAIELPPARRSTSGTSSRSRLRSSCATSTARRWSRSRSETRRPTRRCARLGQGCGPGDSGLDRPIEPEPLTVARLLAEVFGASQPDLIFCGAQSSDAVTPDRNRAWRACSTCLDWRRQAVRYDAEAGSVEVDRELEGGSPSGSRYRRRRCSPFRPASTSLATQT